MLEEIYIRDENLQEDDYYDALYYLLGDIYPNLSDEELEDMVEDILDELPEEYAENFLQTIGNIGKNIGSGALRFTAKHPGLVKGAATLAGTLIGGPVGAKVGNMVGNWATNGAQQFLPKTAQTLSLIQNPQTQAALARTSIGLGNGAAPLVLDDNTAYVSVATHLNAIIQSAQAALQEIDRMGQIPPAELTNSYFDSDDIDEQAEWLIESLTGGNKDKNVIILFIGGAGDKTKFLGSGPNGNMKLVKNYFDSILKKDGINRNVKTVYLGFEEVFAAKKIEENVISHTNSLNDSFCIIGHSLGAWNGAHLSQKLDEMGYSTELLVTLDPVGKGVLVETFADIYISEPKPIYKFWINICALPNKKDTSDRVADFGEQWKPAGFSNFMNYETHLHHYNAKGMFMEKMYQKSNVSVEKFLLNHIVISLYANSEKQTNNFNPNYYPSNDKTKVAQTQFLER